MDGHGRQAAPAPLVTAASLVALEALVMLGLAAAELFSTDGGRLLLGLTTTLFFGLYGVLLLVCAWLVTRGVGWTRGPILLAQLIQLGIAWSIRDVESPLVLGLLVVVSLVVLAGMLHPASLRFLLEDATPEDSGSR